jgi:hypothetical protein
MHGTRFETRLFLAVAFIALVVIAATGWMVRQFMAMARWAGIVEARS